MFDEGKIALVCFRELVVGKGNTENLRDPWGMSGKANSSGLVKGAGWTWGTEKGNVGGSARKDLRGKLCNQSLDLTSNPRERKPKGESLGVFSAKGSGGTREGHSGPCR